MGRLAPTAITSSARTSTAPTGTSPAARAARACSSARLIKASSRLAAPRCATWLTSRRGSRARGSRGRKKQRRIDETRVERHAEVQVRPGHATGRADFANDHARLYALPAVHINRAQVAVHGDKTRAVIDDHCVAIEEVVPGIHHTPVGRCVHRRTGVGGDIHAAVRVARLIVEYAPRPK